jgi:membrane protein YdbS with pleckstrin-like domain
MIWDKLWATWWAIACGIGLVDYLFHMEERPWSIVGAFIYFLLFMATLYQIKAKQSVWEWLWERHKARKAWRDDPNNWSV